MLARGGDTFPHLCSLLDGACLLRKSSFSQAAKIGSKTLEDMKRNNMQIARMTDGLKEVRAPQSSFVSRLV